MMSSTHPIAGHRLVDLSVDISPDVPCIWPGNPDFKADRLNWYDDEQPYFNRLLTADEHVGTHFDVPAHFIPAPDSGHPDASPLGLTTDAIDLGRLLAPAAVIDASPLLGTGEGRVSPKVTRAHVEAWEAEHGALAPGDAALVHTGWSDRHYRAFPDGRRYAEAVLSGELAPWPALDREAMAHLANRGVMVFGADTPSAGPLDDVAAVHVTGLERGMVFVENLIGLGGLPARGALFIFLPLKLSGGSGAPGRAIALVPDAEGPR